MWHRILNHLLRGMLRKGDLTVCFPGGDAVRYGDATGPAVTVRLLDPAVPRRLVLGPDLALGEGYMDGTITVDGDDLAGFLALLLHNAAGGRANWWRHPLSQLHRGFARLGQINPAGRSRRNVAHHYDLSDELYALFLDADRQYSCAYFRSPSDSLEQAQAQKKAHIAAKLRLTPGMRVLDIGCGWGGMALTLARDHGARVLGITLSQEQHRTATTRAAEAGLADRVDFRLMDYRAVTGSFDRIVSVGMFEHVGVPQYGTYFARVRDLLTPDGVALIHTIGRMAPPGTTSPWVTKYIFPGGYVPALSETMAALEPTGLWATDIEIWRLHYAETLRHWRDRFEARIDRARALYDERFCRMWRYYLVASEMTFRHYEQCVFQIQLARRQDAVPLTRDYITEATRAAAFPAAAAGCAGG